jgi:predicted Zn-dependent protease
MGALRAWFGRHRRLTVWGLLAVVGLLGVAGYQWSRQAEVRAASSAVRQLADRGEWKAANEQLERLLTRHPDDPDFRLIAARVERRLDHPDEAKRHLDHCQRLQGEETRPIQVERALLRVHAGGLAEVEAFLRDRVQQDDPAAVEILDVLSTALERSYRDAEAQRCLDQLLKRQPDHFDALVRRGLTAKNMQWYEDAAGYFERAVAVRPNADQARLLLAETLGIYGQFAQAREQFEKLRAKRPNDPGLQFGLALCAAGTGEYDTARTLFDKLLAANPDNWTVLLERGKLAMQTDRPDQAVDDLKRADALAPPDVAPIPLVQCLLLLGRADEARKYQEKVDRIQAENARVIELSDHIRDRAPDDPQPRYDLGRVLIRLGKPREAVHWLRTAVEKDPKHRPSHEALAEFFQSVNDVNQAEYHRRILQSLPAGPK